jgi:hypothetical protein
LNDSLPDKRLPAQPVDATPSAINLFSKGGVYDATETGEAFREPADGLSEEKSLPDRSA